MRRRRPIITDAFAVTVDRVMGVAGRRLRQHGPRPRQRASQLLGVGAIEAAGGTACFIAADLGNLDDVARLVADAGDVDILVNNAGVFPFAPTHEVDAASFDETFAVHVRPPFFLTAALAPKMAARGGGSIVNLATMVAHFGMAGAAA